MALVSVGDHKKISWESDLLLKIKRWLGQTWRSGQGSSVPCTEKSVSEGLEASFQYWTMWLEHLSSRWRVETNEAGELEALWAMQWNHDTISIQKALGSPWKGNIVLCILENSSGYTMLHGLERNKPRGKGAAPIILMITAGCYHEDEEKWISLKDIEHLGREGEWVCSEGGQEQWHYLGFWFGQWMSVSASENFGEDSFSEIWFLSVTLD